MNWEVETDSRIYCCVISGSVSGVADCSVLVRCETVPYVSKGRLFSPSFGLSSPVELH